MSKTIEEIRKELDAPLPRSAVRERKTSGNYTLSYVEGHYVIDRLNQVFGQGNWSYRHELKLVSEKEIDGKYYAAYLASVTLEIRGLTEGGDGTKVYYKDFIEYNDVGYGDGFDRSYPGKAHESAAKEAVTDGLKRCAKSLGMSMGLALYSKEQENVSEDESERVVKVEPTPSIIKSPYVTATTTKNSYSFKEEPKVKPIEKEEKQPKTNTNVLAIQAAARVLDAQGKLKKEEFKKQYLTKYGVSKTVDLAEAQTAEVYNELKTKYPELSL